jgi:succinoglycan biosynthesis transport protein ExoP
VIGGATIATQEMMVVGIMSKNDVEQQFGLPMLAAVPAVKKLEHPADLLIDRPTSLFSEAIRIARASILGVKRSDKGQQIIAVTSALPGEGKSTTALAFARMLAIHGSKTLLIECDVRRAILQTHVRNPVPKAGIIEVLFGDAPIEAALFPGDVDNLTQLFATAPFFDSGELFGDARMKSLLDTLRQQYDHIVLDLPPLVGLADSRYLAVQADTTVMVVRWARTPVNAVSTALEWLKSDGANVAGVVLTMIDPGAEAAGAYYYSKKYSGYYQNK